jgi:hypothetical protein
MPKRVRPPLSIILTQAQVLGLTRNIRRACDEIERGEKEARVSGVRLRNISPLQTLRNQAQWVETLFAQQNGAKRIPEAWDSDEDSEN